MLRTKLRGLFLVLWMIGGAVLFFSHVSRRERGNPLNQIGALFSPLVSLSSDPVL